MKEKLLLEIDDNVQQITEAISSILGLDVDITGIDLQRVSGIGKFALNINKEFIAEGKAFRQIVESKKPLFIEDSVTSQICRENSNLNKDKNHCEIRCPIFLNDNVTGTITMSSQTLEQKKQIHKNQIKYLNFLENIADLISTKVLEHINYQETSAIFGLLYKLLNLMYDGVIILNSNDDIIYINKKTELFFGNTLAQITYFNKINQFGLRKVIKNDSVELNIKIKGKMLKLYGQLYPIGVGAKVNQVFIFQDIELNNKDLIQTNTMEEYAFKSLIENSNSIIELREQCNILSVNENNILIYGETSTGKEIFAHSIHKNSIRKDKPFVTITCTGASESSLEDDIFGKKNKENPLGKLTLAAGGTLFIDEISDLPMRLQGKLMNLIYKGELKCRIIATTNRNLKNLVSKGDFRENLFYALDTFTLFVPPLRRRKEDIVPLAKHFLNRYNYMEGKEIELDKDIYDTFLNYSWPGNIRELSNVISYIIAYCNGKDKVSLKNLPSGLISKLTNIERDNFNLEENERELIIKALNSYGNSQYSKSQIAKEMGISKATLYRKLKKYNIEENKIFVKVP